jgi:hypothetical protein
MTVPGDLRSVPEPGRPREHVENHGRASTQVLFLCKADLGFFHFLEIFTGWLVPPLVRRSHYSLTNLLLKTGFFIQVRELKMQMQKARLYFTGNVPDLTQKI